ncbi:MAG: ABC transporter ATP-binding protein [Candidatus Cloacimonetes bacterium]|nr:ABC transporter ATP-binding protein [Candidatus Cloacimonadota bacterium]
MKSIKIKDLSFAYQLGNSIFTNASLELPFNEITFLNGANGSGKTTLCRILSGLEKGYTGFININDLDLKPVSFTERAKSIIYLKQEPLSNIVAATPEEDLALWQHGFDKHYDESSSELRERVMERLRINDLKDKPFWELSGGQIKRIGLAALLINYDKYWILDEPISGLDNTLIRIFIEILEERKALGKGCLIISHKEDYFVNLIDKNYFIENKKIESLPRGTFEKI